MCRSSIEFSNSDIVFNPVPFWSTSMKLMAGLPPMLWLPKDQLWRYFFRMQCPASWSLHSAIFWDSLGRFPHRFLFVLWLCQGMLSSILSIRVYMASRRLYSFCVSVHESHPYSKTDSTVAVKSLILTLFCSDDFQIFVSLWQTCHASAFLTFTSFSVLAIHAPRYWNCKLPWFYFQTLQTLDMCDHSASFLFYSHSCVDPLFRLLPPLSEGVPVLDEFLLISVQCRQQISGCFTIFGGMSVFPYMKSELGFVANCLPHYIIYYYWQNIGCQCVAL